MAILRPKVIGIDLYDMPLKAVEKAEGVFIDSKLEDMVYDIPKMTNYREAIIEFIKDRRYLGNLEITNAILQYVNKKSGARIMKPKLLLSAPSDISNGKFGDIFMRMLSEAGITAGSSQVKLIENLMCAAIGSGLEVEVPKKIPFIYVNEWCAYISIIFAGTLLKPKYIEKNYQQISIEEIIDVYEDLLSSLPREMPKLYHKQNVYSNISDQQQTNWLLSVDEKIHLAVPTVKRQEYGMGYGKYSFHYVNNYEDCIIRGLEILIGDKGVLDK